jgi:putative lipoprotein
MYAMRNVMKVFQRYLILFGLLLLSACTQQDQPRITGTLNYSSPVKLEKNTRLELLLTDVSTDGPALRVASAIIKDLAELPYQYSLPYSKQDINPEHRYTIEARVYTDGSLRFATDTAYEVLNREVLKTGSLPPQNLLLIDVNSNESTPLNNTVTTSEEQFRGELRTDNGVALYRIGVVDGHIIWLEEERSNGTPNPAQARYQFKGAWLQYYRDSSGLEIEFDSRGRPHRMRRQEHVLDIKQQTDVLSSVRNQAELLRSHALAARESQTHRLATENWQGMSGLSQVPGH